MFIYGRVQTNETKGQKLLWDSDDLREVQDDVVDGIRTLST